MINAQCFVVYEKRTGEILRSGSCPSDAVGLQAQQEHEAIIMTKTFIDGSKYYILGGCAVPKSPLLVVLPAEVKVGQHIQVEVPDGLVVTISGDGCGCFKLPDGEFLELVFDLPGEYVISLSAGARYLRRSYAIHVV